MKKRILITGKSGVTGAAFQNLESEISNKYELFFSSSSVCDLTNLQDSLNYIKDIKPNYIINLAAKSGGIGMSASSQATLLRDNLLININILEIARKINIEKILLVLSSGIYPEKADMPFKESSLHDGQPHISAYGYSFAKRIIEPSIRAYREEFNLNVIGAIPNGIFGKNDNFSDDAPMLPSLIRRFYMAKDNKENIEVWGDGSPLREYTYSIDVAKSFLWMIENYDEPISINTGSTEENSIKDIAMAIAKIMNIDSSRIIFNTDKPSGIFRKPTDNSIFINKSDFKFTLFKDGLVETIKWFDETFKNNKNDIKLTTKV
mgnify:CR=1 FL=1